MESFSHKVLQFIILCSWLMYLHIRLNTVGEFIFINFGDYYMWVGIDVKYLVPNIHVQNRLSKSFIKSFQVFVQLNLLLHIKLLVSTWRHAFLYTATLIRLRHWFTRGLVYHYYSPLQFVPSHQFDISNLRPFGCSAQVHLRSQHYYKIYNKSLLK